MPDEPKVGHLSVSDVSSAIAFGLQRAIDSRPAEFKDRWLIYGGRLEFTIQALPQGMTGPIRDVADLGAPGSS